VDRMMARMPAFPREVPMVRKIREVGEVPKGIEGFKNIIGQLDSLKEQFPEEREAIDAIIGSIDDLVIRLEAPAPARAKKKAPRELPEEIET